MQLLREMILMVIYAGAEPITSSYGTIGHISTDELLARRRQRQQAERMAHLASQGRSSFARKPMASLQPHVNQSKPASTGKEAAANCLAAPATVNPLSRAAKRPLEKTSHSVAAPQETVGVSTEDLVKVAGLCAECRFLLAFDVASAAACLVGRAAAVQLRVCVYHLHIGALKLPPCDVSLFAVTGRSC